MYISTDVAERIKEMAKIRSISVKQLLENVGLGFNTMSNMKTSMPKADNLARIADYLDCSVDYLLGRTDTPTVDISSNIGSITPLEAKVLFAYREKTNMQAAVNQLLNIKSEDQPSTSIATENAQDSSLDRIIKLVDTRIASGELDPNNAKIAAFGGYEQTATGAEAEELAEIKRLVQDVLEEQRKKNK